MKLSLSVMAKRSKVYHFKTLETMRTDLLARGQSANSKAGYPAYKREENHMTLSNSSATHR